MDEINNQGTNWSGDVLMERRQQHDRIVFENVADQYVKGEDVTAFFIISHGTEINPNEDQIGLLRVGCTNIKKCLAYAPVQINPSTTSGSIRHGIATFPSLSLPVTNDEFYQFCYLNKKTTNLASSIPFQLNCALDDMDFLCNTSTGTTSSLSSLDDNDNDDLVIIHTKRLLSENKLRQEDRHSFNIKRSLELPKNTHPTCVELQSRHVYHSLCQQDQSECLKTAERCRTIEDSHTKLLDETKQIRSQFAVTLQFTKDQATQIIDLERRLIQANELVKKSHQRQIFLEQQTRDLQLTSEKHQRSLQGQANQSHQRQMILEQQIRDLQLTSEKYQRSMQGQVNQSNQYQMILERQIRDLKLTSEKYQISMQGQLNAYSKQTEYPMESNDQAYMMLKNSFSEIEKRCVKHQKSEMDLKRQLNIYHHFVNDLQREIQHLTERLSTSAEEYNTLFRKYNARGCQMEINHEQEQNDVMEKKEHIDCHLE